MPLPCAMQALHGTERGGGNGNDAPLGMLKDSKGPGEFLYDTHKPAP